MTDEFLAFDLGAESGRAMLGRFDGERLHLTEVHRFANRPVAAADGLHWDVEGLFAEIKRGLALCCEQYGPPASIGIDTWGVDFALLDERRAAALRAVPLSRPAHGRDDGGGVQARPAREIFEQTGIQFLPFNTLYQLLSMAARRVRRFWRGRRRS